MKYFLFGVVITAIAMFTDAYFTAERKERERVAEFRKKCTAKGGDFTMLYNDKHKGKLICSSKSPGVLINRN